ncbi:unnamed protein product [Blepharisma stoltei]|uniref:Enamelin n=1 Tax=Blepharisma stoltei TaxID=1481888 RepID=A0AAU9JC84_9CILI|nr:unnamed protein product [Blepharisma stoltei]
MDYYQQVPAPKVNQVPPIQPQELSFYLDELSKVSDRDSFNALMRKFDETFLHRFKQTNPQAEGVFPFGGNSNPYNLNNPGISNPYTMNPIYPSNGNPRSSSLERPPSFIYSGQQGNLQPRANLDMQDQVYKQPMYERGGYFPEPLDGALRGRERIPINIGQPYNAMNQNPAMNTPQPQPLYDSQSYSQLPSTYTAQPQLFSHPQGYSNQGQLYIPNQPNYPPYNPQPFPSASPDRIMTPNQPYPQYRQDFGMSSLNIKNPIQESIDLRKMKEDALNKYHHINVPQTSQLTPSSQDQGVFGTLPGPRYRETNTRSEYQGYKSSEAPRTNYQGSLSYTSNANERPSYLSSTTYNQPPNPSPKSSSFVSGLLGSKNTQQSGYFK